MGKTLIKIIFSCFLKIFSLLIAFVYWNSETKWFQLSNIIRKASCDIFLSLHLLGKRFGKNMVRIQSRPPMVYPKVFFFLRFIEIVCMPSLCLCAAIFTTPNYQHFQFHYSSVRGWELQSDSLQTCMMAHFDSLFQERQPNYHRAFGNVLQ